MNIPLTGVLVFLKRKFDKLIIDVKFSNMAYQWRERNRHNRTFAARFFPLDRVIVGKNTYGMLDVRSFCDNAGEMLRIGSYVSIAEGVVFILGGQHQTNTFTTFPLKAYFSRKDNNQDSSSKGPIEIEDEVWIGTNSIILSGVKIGKGSIVGAGAVVTKDIPPYTVAAGNPAKVIRYRFSSDLIAELMVLNLSDISDKNIKENINVLYERIDDEGKVLHFIKSLGG